MVRLAVIGAIVFFAACEGTVNQPPAMTEKPWNAETRLDMLPADALPVGIAVTPSGRRYVLDRRHGLYELNGVMAAGDTEVLDTVGPPPGD
jgi:hypothetical protein